MSSLLILNMNQQKQVQAATSTTVLLQGRDTTIFIIPAVVITNYCFKDSFYCFIHIFICLSRAWSFYLKYVDN